jgi:hypothetical protein
MILPANVADVASMISVAMAALESGRGGSSSS